MKKNTSTIPNFAENEKVVKKIFAERLKEIRTERQLTQKVLADRCEISVGQIAKYEKGQELPSGASLVRLSTILNVSVDWLLTISDKSSRNNQYYANYFELFSVLDSLQSCQDLKNTKITTSSDIEDDDFPSRSNKITISFENELLCNLFRKLEHIRAIAAISSSEENTSHLLRTYYDSQMDLLKSKEVKIAPINLSDEEILLRHIFGEI